MPAPPAADPASPPPEPHPQRRYSVLRIAGWFVFLALLSSFAYLFYLHGYRPLIANSSSSSTIELIRRKLEVSRAARTLVIGNSAAAEGFHASVYNRVLSASGPAINLCVPSAHMFLFEKMLHMALDRGLRPDNVAIVLTPESLSFSSSPYYDYLTNDLNVLKVELNLGDLLRLPLHTPALSNLANHAGLTLLRPALFSGDLLDFSFRPVQRLKDAEIVDG